MTEEIIIDGVNIAGCEFYQIEANQLYPKAQYCGSMRNTFCENEPNCYYKQLKRLEQENTKQKEMIERQWKLLEQCGVSAGGELKRVSYLLEKYLKENKELKEEVKLFRYAHDNEQDRRRKFEDCLQEIKDYLNTLSGIDNDFVNTETYLRILDCITKAEEE